MLGGLGVLFWLIIVVTGILWLVGYAVPAEWRTRFWTGGFVLLFVLILILGVKLFGPPFHLSG